MGEVKLIFWISAGIVFYTYLGYGILLWLLVRIKEYIYPPKENTLNKDLPEVTIMIAAYNEEDVAEEKMKNTLELDYPPERLKILWITDGSTDRTVDILNNYNRFEILNDRFEVFHKPERRGKTSAINRAMQFTDTPIVVFSDANTMLNPEAIEKMVSLFGDPIIGCVAAEKRISRVETGKFSTKGEGLYWRYESFIKRLDSRFYTVVGAAGELYAIRRELFEEMDETVLLDDFMLSMNIASKGYRIAYCPAAYAVEGGSHNLAEERKRKVRIAAGGVQSVIKLWKLLNFFRYPLLSFQYISHRVLRWTVTPVALFLLFPLNLYILLYEGSIYYLLLLFQIIFYALGIAGILFEKRGPVSKVVTIPGYFLFMNINVIKGFFYQCGRKNGGAWEKTKRA